MDLQTELTAEAYLAKGQWLEEHPNVEMLSMFPAWT
jgi:hypothetical protein